MKASMIIFIVLCGGIAGAIVYLTHSKVPPPPAPPPVVQLPSATTTEPAPTAVAAPAPIRQPAGNGSEETAEPAATSAAGPAVAVMDSDTNSIGKAVDALLAAKNGAQKHELFQKLVQSGQIDEAIAELKQRAADNTNDAEIPTTLGEAQLNKVRALKEAGGDYNEIGILAMQADQSFNAALKIDPQNWEAQFVKSSSQYYWPANPQMDNDVVQHLSGLIDQQETMPSQPEFAQTYVVLGNEYQKIGQPDKAMATWELGAQKFPNDPTLQKKINGQ